jgi:antitoxin component YwqK of YwqJK toxin-antitoxin module
MNRDTAYVSSIPATARAKVTARYVKIGPKRVEYYVADKLVGVRELFITGEPEAEWSFKDRFRHGVQYRWYAPDELLSREPYEDGAAHGVAYE